MGENFGPRATSVREPKRRQESLNGKPGQVRFGGGVLFEAGRGVHSGPPELWKEASKHFDMQTRIETAWVGPSRPASLWGRQGQTIHNGRKRRSQSKSPRTWSARKLLENKICPLLPRLRTCAGLATIGQPLTSSLLTVGKLRGRGQKPAVWGTVPGPAFRGLSP